MADSTQSSIVIEAPAAAVLAVIADLEAYPQWAGGINSVTVLESDGDRPVSARFTVHSGPVKDTYVLAYDWSAMTDEGGTVSWALTEGGITRKLDGAYTLAESAGSTTVTYTLAVDIAISLPGLLKRKAEKKIVDTALRDLKATVTR